ncbi:MAG: uroporphyrinogen-III synthase [Methylovulum sp.]|nr:uroporphyrinogen-III synthase [Methylovulum sp.]
MAVLNGIHVLVTRPAHQGENLSRLILQQGGIAIRLPTLEIRPVDDAEKIKAKLAVMDTFQWLVFVSANAVTMHNYYLDGGRMPHPYGIRFAAIGAATAQAMALAGLPVDLVPEQGYSSEDLLAMGQLQEIEGQSFLIVRGEGGREALATILRNRGATVDYLDVYKRAIPAVDILEVLSLLAQGRLDAVTITSGEALQNLLMMLGERYHQPLFAIKLIVVSDRIRQMAAELGFKQIVVAAGPSDAAILEAVTKCLTGE